MAKNNNIGNVLTQMIHFTQVNGLFISVWILRCKNFIFDLPTSLKSSIKFVLRVASGENLEFRAVFLI